MLNLFNPKIPLEEAHHNFKELLNDKDLMRVIESWSIGFEDRDNKFVNQFQETFNSSFWEIYLHAAFQNLGFNIDYSYDRPDFIMNKKKQEIVVEAVTANNPKSGTPEYEREAAFEELSKLKTDRQREQMQEKVVNLAAERIYGSFIAKSDMYLNKYSQLPHVKNKPYIIAIGVYEQPLFYFQGLGGILRVLYGLKKAQYKYEKPNFEYQEHILKQTGTPLEVGFFKTDAFKHVSGVLFNPTATIGKARALSLKKYKNIFFDIYTYNDYGPKGNLNLVRHDKYRESLLDGTNLFLNPFAANPVNPILFDNPDIAIHYDENKCTIKNNFLYRRLVNNGNK